MPEPSPVRTRRVDPTSPASLLAPHHVVAHRLHLAALVAEARHLARRRVVVEAASARAQRRRGVAPAVGGGAGVSASARARARVSASHGSRLARRAGRLGVTFHRLLDQLHAGGLHEEALAIFRTYRVELSRRLARIDHPRPPRV